MSNRVSKVPAVASLPSPSSSTGGKTNQGSLYANVLSVYDLPAWHKPTAVTMQVCGLKVSTGPPSSRHKEHNSFRFNGNKSGTEKSSGEVTIEAPLRDLYSATAVFTVESSNPDKPFAASVKLDTVVIGETQWLILNLEGGEPNAEGIPPTLRLKLKLHGPFRPEIAALVAMGKGWFGVMDKVEDSWSSVVATVPSVPISSRYVLVPMAPVAAALVVLSPIVIGIMVVTLPVFLPFLVVIASILVGAMAVGSIVYFSTSSGREQLSTVVLPVKNTLMSTKAGQCLVYETGPRPTPVSVARVLLPKEMWGKLGASLLIDLTGSASYLLPIVGEALDLAWAPIQTVLIMAMYDTVAPNLKYVSFAEEILPLTDVVPSATIGWLKEFGPELFPQGTKLAADSLDTNASVVPATSASMQPQSSTR